MKAVMFTQGCNLEVSISQWTVGWLLPYGHDDYSNFYGLENFKNEKFRTELGNIVASSHQLLSVSIYI
jgi:hypothetical protein